jgi:hypothetical protein
MWTAALSAALCLTPGASAVTLPGGKPNWVVSVGGLNTPDVNNNGNWVRLGYYTFSADGAVTTNYWTWAMLSQSPRIDTWFADCAGDVPDCYVKTVDGFLDSPMGGLIGSFDYLANGQLRITWTKNADGSVRASPLVETWNVDSEINAGTLARIRSSTFYQAPNVPAPGEFSNYSATFGIGYGSMATLSTTSKATMQLLMQDARYNDRSYDGANVVVTHGELLAQTSGGRWHFSNGISDDPYNANNPWQLCASGKCIAWNQHMSSCSCGDAWPTKDRIRYFADVTGGRRNTEWFWCKCLAQGTACYKSNSHVRPLLQIVDDQGTFQGWVGVEASTAVGTKTQPPKVEDGHFSVFELVPEALDGR